MGTVQDENADTAVVAMMTAASVAASVPGPVNWVAFSAVLGSGVVAIGLAYGTQVTKDEAYKLIKQFVLGAGFTFLALTVGSKILGTILAVTGLGYFAAVAMDVAISTAIAYAVGESAKAYFKGERNKKELGRIFAEKFKSKHQTT